MKEIWVDGSCSGNPGSGGWAAIIVENDKAVDVLCDYSDSTTNNRMELIAIIESLDKYYKEPITIYSDSAYCVNMYNNWIDTWQANGWVRSKNKPIENLDLVQKLYWAKRIAKDIQVTKVAGHSGIKYNEIADKLATGQITRDEVIEKYG